MHIVQVYHSKVPVALYGGMERVIEALISGFLELGHKVTLMAYRGDYDIPGINFIDFDRFETLDEAILGFNELIPSDADIVHFHVPFVHPKVDFPQLTTLHGLLGEGETLPENTMFISKKHAMNHGGENFIYHGLDPELIPFSEISLENREYFSFLGRASLKRKGLHLAKRIAKEYKTKLFVGGGRGISFRNIKFLGHLDNKKKYDLLRGSKAMLFPILWEEPFGLVMIEAMFCGTPVWGLNSGSVPEVLGQSGGENIFVRADDIDELIENARNYDFKVSPKEIRDYAVKHFSHILMCEKYINYFKTIL